MVACTVGGADDDDTSNGPTSADDDDGASLTMDATTPIDDGGGPSTDTIDGTSATSSPSETSTTADASAEDPSDDDASDTIVTTDSSSSTGDGHNDACVAGCMIEFGCQDTCECDTTWKSEEACVSWCEANLEKAALFTEFCRDAWENMSACIGTLDCEGYHEFHNPAVPDYPCVSEADSLAFECKGQ
jgi:hypothetical protein